MSRWEGIFSSKVQYEMFSGEISGREEAQEAEVAGSDEETLLSILYSRK